MRARAGCQNRSGREIADLVVATGNAEIETVEPGMPAEGEQSAVNGGKSAIDIADGQTETGEASDPAHAVAAE